MWAGYILWNVLKQVHGFKEYTHTQEPRFSFPPTPLALNNKYEKVKGEVELEKELVSALKNLKVERNNIKVLEKELSELR